MLQRETLELDQAIKMLEEELEPHSELARILDKSSNYYLSIRHHKACVSIIESILNLKSKQRRAFTYDFTTV